MADFGSFPGHCVVDVNGLNAVDDFADPPGEPARGDLALPGLEDAVASLRSTMGDETFDAAWQSGWTMPIDQVMDQIASQPRSITPRVTAAQ